MALAFNTTGSGGTTQSNAIPKYGASTPAPLNTNYNIPQGGLGLSINPNSTPAQNKSTLGLGTNPGIVNHPAVPTAPVASHTTTTNPATGQTTTKQTFQPVPAYGSTVTDAAGRTGTAMFDPNTGQPLTNPNAGTQGSAGTTSGMLNTQQTNSQINPTTGVNANNSTTAPQYTPPNQGTTGVNQGGLIGNLVNQSQTQSPAYTNAANAYQGAIGQYNQSVQNEAAALAANAGNPIPLEFQQGRGQILQNQYTQQQAGLGGLVSGASNALGAANTQQGLQVQAGTAAGQLNAPQPYGLYSTPFSPSSGQFGQLAGTAATGGAGGLAGVGALQQQQSQGADVQTMTSAYKQTSGLIDKAKQDISNSNFNVSPIAFGNYLQGLLEGKVAPNPQYANVLNDLTEIASTIAPVLGTPGNPTDTKTIMAQELIPRLMQGQNIGQVLDNLEQNAAIKIGAAGTAAGSNAITNPLTPPTSATTGGASSGFATTW